MSRENSAEQSRRGGVEEESGKERRGQTSRHLSPLIDILPGPGLQFMPFVVMEDLLDKLKLLDYEVEFVSELRMRPLNRLVISVLVNCYLSRLFNSIQALLRAADQPRGTVLHVLLPGCLAYQEVR